MRWIFNGDLRGIESEMIFLLLPFGDDKIKGEGDSSWKGEDESLSFSHPMISLPLPSNFSLFQRSLSLSLTNRRNTPCAYLSYPG